ncbi:MAG: T9SS type A sorting domain-containing protein [Elusimicrobia bacterium]|nr:T9SS type A sorting domain-containing protein [Elusimicrobiota bacterium]
MYKILIFSILIVSFCGISRADKRTDKLRKICDSVATPRIYKNILKRVIKNRESALERREKARHFRKKARAFSASKAESVEGISVQTADSAFKLGEVYCYPNPAKKVAPTFHVETGIADKVEIKIYDISGDLAHEAVLSGSPQIIDDGQGPQYAYEYAWNAGNAGSGVYIYSITSEKAGKKLRKSGRCAVIK